MKISSIIRAGLQVVVGLSFASSSLTAQASVNPASGNYSHTLTDYTNVAEPGLSLVRTFNSANAKGAVGPLGLGGWTLPFLTEQLVISQPFTTFNNLYGPYYDYPAPSYKQVTYNKPQTYNWAGHAVITGPNGEKLALRSDALNVWKSLTDSKATVTCISPSQTTTSRTPGPTDWGLLSASKVTGICAAYTITWRDGRVQTYGRANSSNTVYKLSSFTDSNGWSAGLNYDNNGNLANLTSAGGRTLTFSYNSNGTLSQINGSSGYQLNYAYDSSNRLNSVTGPAGLGEHYQYQNSANPNLLTEVDDLAGNLVENISYDGNNHVTQVRGPDGANISNLAYNTDGSVTVTNEHDLTLTYTYQYSREYGYKPVSIVRSDGATANAANATYDDSGRLLSKIDFVGNITNYSYDSTGTQTTITYPNGLVTTKTTDSNLNNVLSLATPTNSTSYTYDTHGNPLTKTVISGDQTQTWIYTYDTLSHVTSVTDPRTGKTSYTYDATGALATIVNALGQTWTVTSVDPAGRPLHITSPANDSIVYVYDGAGRIISRSVNNVTTGYAYTPHGKLSVITRPDNSTLTLTYNSADQLIGKADSNGASETYTVDAAGRPLVINSSNTVGPVAKQSYSYDTLSGKIATATNGVGNSTSLAYDSNGNLSTITDPLSRTTSYGYDGMNALNNIARADGNPISLTRDTLGNVTGEATPDGQTTTYTVNGLGQTTKRVSPDTGITNYTYYPNGLLKTKTDAKGKVATYSYDAIGRVTSVAYTTSPTITYVYDTVRVGALTSITGGGSTLTYGYDSLGHVNAVTQTMGTIVKTAHYTWDAAGKLTGMTTPSGQTVVFTYASETTQPSSVSINGSPVITQFNWQPFNSVPTSWTWANGVKHQRTLDFAGRVSWVQTDNVMSRKLERDAADNITSITDTLSSARSQTFTYDIIDQLLSETTASRNYVYDYGNGINYNRNALTTDAAGGGTAYTFSSGNMNRLVSTTNNATGTTSPTFTYDADGSITKDAKRTYTYDSRERIVSVKVGTTTTSYQYDGLGQRFSKTGALYM